MDIPKIASLILQESVTVRTLLEFQKITGQEMGMAMKELTNVIEDSLEKRFGSVNDFMEGYSVPAKLAKDPEVESAIWHAVATGYDNGYLDGWKDREHLFEGLRRRMEAEDGNC